MSDHVITEINKDIVLPLPGVECSIPIATSPGKYNMLCQEDSNAAIETDTPDDKIDLGDDHGEEQLSIHQRPSRLAAAGLKKVMDTVNPKKKKDPKKARTSSSSSKDRSR